MEGVVMNISLAPISDSDYEEAVRTFGFDDIDAEFRGAFKGKKSIFSIRKDHSLVGVMEITESHEPFLYVYINTPYRRQGIGGAALSLGEQRVSSQAERFRTFYRLDHPEQKLFASKHGYKRVYSSTFMEYSGDSFEIASLPIRGYNDDDYEIAHDLYARAFHEMRTRVGFFPESVVESSSETMRKQWAATKQERYVYTQDGIVVGYAHVVGNDIGSISVDPQKQGQGIGRLFLKYLVNEIIGQGYASVLLACVVGNWAKRLYDSVGFVDLYDAEFATKLRCTPECGESE